jgi:spectinomycin phosphotransferase
VRAPPEDLDESDLPRWLLDGWGLTVAGAEHAAVGGGSYHWRAVDDAGRQHWLTVDDLDQKEFLGDSRTAALAGLRSAFDTALALREGGLEFVVAPVPTPRAETVRAVGTHHAMAVFPLVEGRIWRFGDRLAPAERAGRVDMLARLHRTPPSAVPSARPAALRLPTRGDLESALADAGREWVGGPFSEPARALLAGHAEEIRRLLDTYDRLADEVLAACAEPAVTHGEPHPGNVMSAGGRLLLVDWDTVGLAPPERDLWMVDAGDGDELRRYAEASGRRVDNAAIRLYRLRWRLDDTGIFVKRLRSEHQRSADTEHWWRSLLFTVESSDP